MYPWEKKKKPTVVYQYFESNSQGWEIIEPTLTEINKKMREGTYEYIECFIYSRK